MDGLLGVVVCDEVDGEPVLMSMGHGKWWAERDGWIVTKHVRKLDDLDFVELEGLLSLYGCRLAFILLLFDVGDIVGGGGVFFWRGERQRRDAEMKLLCAHGCGRDAMVELRIDFMWLAFTSVVPFVRCGLPLYFDWLRKKAARLYMYGGFGWQATATT